MTQLKENNNEMGKYTSHRFDVAAFHKMMEAGVIGEGQHLELIEGVICEMSPMGKKHYTWLATFTRKLVWAFGNQALVVPQAPLQLVDPYSQPEPDFVVVKDLNFKNNVVNAEQAAIVIEVSDATLNVGRAMKLKLYAKNGVREYWIVNVAANQLEVYRELNNDNYKTKMTLDAGQTVSPVEFSDVQFEWWIQE